MCVCVCVCLFTSWIHDNKQPVWFTLGIKEVIKGWDKGLQDMCSGEKRKLVIPPALAYGKEGKGSVHYVSMCMFNCMMVNLNMQTHTCINVGVLLLPAAVKFIVNQSWTPHKVKICLCASLILYATITYNYHLCGACMHIMHLYLVLNGCLGLPR